MILTAARWDDNWSHLVVSGGLSTSLSAHLGRGILFSFTGFLGNLGVKSCYFSLSTCLPVYPPSHHLFSVSVSVSVASSAAASVSVASVCLFLFVRKESMQSCFFGEILCKLMWSSFISRARVYPLGWFPLHAPCSSYSSSSSARW